MKASKLFIAGALAITSLSFASCSQDEPAAQPAQASAAITRADESQSQTEWTKIPGYSEIIVNTDKSQEMATLKYYINEVYTYRETNNVITTGDELGKCAYDYNVFNERGGFLIVVNATGDQIYNFLNNQSWPDGFKKCPDSFKGSDVNQPYTLISMRGYEGNYTDKVDALVHDANAIYEAIN